MIPYPRQYCPSVPPPTGGQVIRIIDLNAEIGKLPMLAGRRPATSEAERRASGAFDNLSPFRYGNTFRAKFSGDAAWERPLDGDELEPIVSGSTTLHIMAAEAPQSFRLSAG